MSELERFVSVDIETAGPEPSEYSLLSIGACIIADPERSFYVELQPDGERADPGALAVSGFSLDQLRRGGTAPARALQTWQEWLSANVPAQPVLVAFNAPFDWSFVNAYFHRYLGYNPFGHSALDVKAFAMGALGVEWRAASYRELAAHWLDAEPLHHNALKDAQQQARLFRVLWQQAQSG